MCEVHNRVFGAECVIQLEMVTRNQNKVCEGRAKYLEQQVNSFRTWLSKSCDDVDNAVANIIYWHFDVETAVSDGQCGDVTQFETDSREDIEVQLQDEYHAQMESNVSKSAYSIDGNLHWWKQRISALNQELKLHDEIQDKINSIPTIFKLKTSEQKAWRAYIIKCFKTLDNYRDIGKLGFDGWYIFSTQLYQKLGRTNPIKLKKDLLLLPDRVQYYENKMERKKNELEAAIPMVAEMSMEALEK